MTVTSVTRNSPFRSALVRTTSSSTTGGGRAGERIAGRDPELAELTALVTGVDRRGGSLLLRGEPGIGKSTLLRAAAGLGREHGLEVLQTTGVQAEAGLAFAGLHQLLRPVLREARKLPGLQRRALGTVFGDEDGPAPDPFLIALAALNLLTEAAEQRPVLVLADDTQWLDRQTQEVLAFAARRIGTDPVVLVGSLRAGYEGPLEVAVGRVREMEGLSDGAARELIARTAPGLSAPGREQVLREALGNPLALVELPRAFLSPAGAAPDPVARQLPLTVRLERAFAGRIGDLPARTRDALLIAAADPADSMPEILAAAARLAGQSVGTEAWTPAVGAGLVHVDETRVVFRHPLVRSAVLQREPLPRRQAAHAALAAVLAGEPYRRSWHRSQAIVGPDDKVAAELAATSEQPLRQGTVLTAIWALHRSAQLTADVAVRGHRLLLAAGHAVDIGRADLAGSLTSTAAGYPLEPLDQARLQWLRELLDDGLTTDTGRIDRICDTAEFAGAEGGDAELAVNLLHAASLRTWWSSPGAAAQARITETLRKVPGGLEQPRGLAVLAIAEPVAEGATVTAELDRLPAERLTDPAALHSYGQAAHALGDPPAAIRFLGRAERLLREQGRLGLLAQALTMQVPNRLELGDWDQAAIAGDEARRLSAETGQPNWEVGANALGAILEGLRGDPEQALVMAADVENRATPRLRNTLARAQLARGYSWLRLGRAGDAYREFARMFDPADPACHEAERFHAIAPLAEAARLAGRDDDARRVIARLDKAAALTPAGSLHVQLDYARAVLAPDDEAEPLFRAALARDLIGWPWHRARLDLAYGSWLRRHRRTVASRLPLRAAHTAFELIGAGYWAELAAVELRAAGERPAAAEPAAYESLNAQELQVARMAAAGLSNREIGERLFLSPRTIGSILYRMFPKLGITSRGQLKGKVDPSPIKSSDSSVP